MLTKEMFVDIIVRHRQGQSMRRIATELGISRNTVKKHLTCKALLSYSKRATKPTKLDPFKAYLQQRIEAARPHWIPAVVLLREVTDKGYIGGITQLRKYVSPFRRPVQETLIRFETDPGFQMQIDFTTIRRGKRTLKAFVATLGYSRACFVKFYSHEQADAWQDGLCSAFDYFGGVPKEVLCDNAKALVIQRDAYGEGQHKWHTGMLQLAKNYGFQLKACRPYRAKTKGKVERFNHYLKNSFIVPLAAELKQQGLELDVQLANGKVGAWLSNVAHQRLHGTTGEQPQQRLEEEQQYLLALPQFVQLAPISGDPCRADIVPPVDAISLQHPMSVYEQLMEEYRGAIT